MVDPKSTLPTLHFGYGSNLWKVQMQERCPQHREVGRAKLRGYRWVISTRGYANVVLSPGDEVEGMLYELTATDEAELDRREGVAGGSYYKQVLSVTIGAEMRQAIVYVDPITAEGQPRAEYIQRLNAGIRDAGLSPAYVQRYIRPFVPEDPPFESPANQQAHAPIRGFAFQFWLTVDAWLSLSDGARLFVERAEDFAAFAPNQANVTQAKSLAQPISLRSNDVLEAVAHFWAFQQQAPFLPLRFAFVTTAEISREKDDPFQGASGLGLWRQAALNHDLTQAEQIRRFLTTDGSVGTKLPSDVLAGLRALSVEAFFERFIVGLVWDTGHDDHTGVKEVVEQRLQNLAVYKFGLNPGQANGLPAVLFQTVVEIAATGGQVALTWAQLLKAAEGYFAPQTTAMAAARRAGALGAVLTGTTGADDWNFALATVPIQPADELARRREAVAAFASIVAACPFVVLAGSTGMGKTTLAQLVSAARGGAWLQLQLRQDLGQALAGLRECVSLLDGKRRPAPGLIIDDLPWDELGSAGENILRALAYVVRQSDARVIFTNQKEPSARQLAAVGLGEARIQRVPELTTEEIKDVAIRMGCPDTTVRDQWAALLELQTLGHPQLVHASLVDLRVRGWPAPTAAELVAGANVIREERERNQALLGKRSPEEYEFLVRLSIFFGAFRRDQALALAQQLEPLAKAGAAFEQLRGPWIEPVRKDYFRLSPLVMNAGASGATPERQKALNRAVVAAVHSCSPVYATDAAHSLMNSILGQDHAHAQTIILRLLTAPTKQARGVYEFLRWSLVFTAERVFAADAWTDAIFRLMQFVVAGETVPDKALKFYTFLESAMGRLAEGQVRTIRGLLGMELLQLNQVALPLAKVFALVPTVRDMVEEMAQTEPKIIPKLGIPFRAETPGEQIEAAYAMVILNRAQGLSFLEELWQLLEQSPATERTAILRILGRCRALLLLAFDRGWLEEERKPERSWNRALQIYQRYLVSAQQWNDELLLVAAARALAIIHDEYLNDEAAALAVLDQAKLADPELAGVIAELRAKTALVNQHYPEAARLYAIALGFPPVPGLSNLPQEQILHNAGTAAGYAEDWLGSARHFLAAQALAIADEDWTRAGAFATDAGYALWRAGDKEKAIDLFAEALTLTDRMPDPSTDLASLKVQKILGNTLLRLAWGDGGRATAQLTSPILPGMCSNPAINEAMRTLPTPMPGLIWTFLLILEFEETKGSRYWDEHFPRLAKTPFPGMRYVVLEMEARKTLREGRFGELLPVALKLAEEFAASSRRPKGASLYDWKDDPAERPALKFGLNDGFPVAFFLLCGLTAAVVRGVEVSAIIAGWRAPAKKTVVAAEVGALLDTIEQALNAGLDEASRGVREADTHWRRWAFVLRIIREPKLDPENLAAATLILTLPGWQKTKFDILPDLYRELDPHLSALWRQACENRFAFRSPTLFVPELRALAGRPDGTVQHVARLLLTALPALYLRVPEPMLQEVRDLLPPDQA